jgi:hypothetical protein
MDMAYNIKPFNESNYTKQHLLEWCKQLFGNNGSAISNISWDYYNLAFERRPEFMGWSKTEPTTNTGFTSYNHFSYGDEAQQRIDRYNALELQVNDLRTKIDSAYFSAFYQLVYYPVVAASQMNKKFLYHDKAYIYSKQNRISWYDYAAMTTEAYNRIQEETDYYNSKLQNGKWKGMMSMKPRDLPVFKLPDLPAFKTEKKKGWDILTEGTDTSHTNSYILPAFSEGVSQRYFIDLFLTDSASVNWTAEPSADWISSSIQRGTLEPVRNKNQMRIWVDIDWSKCPKAQQLSGTIIFKGGNKEYTVAVNAVPAKNKLNGYTGFAETNGYVSIFAQHYTACNNRSTGNWQIVDGLGYTGKSIMNAMVPAVSITVDTTTLKQKGSFIAYDFYSFTDTIPALILYALPTHPYNKSFSMRCGLSVDDGPLQIIDFKSNSIARTEEWKQNVLRNNAIRKVMYNRLTPGKHTLRIFAIDPGFILDRMVIDLGGLKQAYSAIPETKLKEK